MDDDLTFGASVWAVEEPVEVSSPPNLKQLNPLSPPEPGLDDTTFNDFDDFGPPTGSEQEALKDDDFGDFGDFGDAETPTSGGFQDLGFEEDVRIAGPSYQREWEPLQVNPLPSQSNVHEVVYEILAPVWENEDILNTFTDEPMREVEGVGQILTTASSRSIYKMLLQTPPPTKPPNWTRSRIRRRHLIALGIPVNLDEVLPKANGRPLPPLEIHTRPLSTPPTNRNHPHLNSAVPGSNHHSRAGTPQPVHQNNVFAQFGPKPELDVPRISRLLEYDSEYLTLQPLSNLERLLAELKMQTVNTSSLLTYLLQSRDALQQDSETYNGLIAELVGEVAQKIKSGKPRTVSKRGSGLL